MNTVDSGVKLGLSMGIEVAKLTGQIVIESLESVLKEMKSNPLGKKNMFQGSKTDQGKMKLNKLFEKHQKGGIISAKDNISKDEYSAIKKEFKKMDVDFSIRKSSENKYSVFLSGKDSQSIEKGMRNVIKKYSKKQDKKMNNISSFNIKNLRTKQKNIDSNRNPDLKEKFKQTKKL